MSHDPSVQPFEATYLPEYGWVVLMPWVRTDQGYWWRPHFAVQRYGVGAETMARHYAAELNAWRDTNAVLAAEQIEALAAEQIEAKRRKLKEVT